VFFMKMDSSKSLIAQADAQLELIPSTAMPAEVFDQDEAHGEFTGERLFARDPEKYRMIVSLLAENIGVIKIGRLLSVSPNTVMAVRDRERPRVDIEKQEIATQCRKGARLCTEAIVEKLSSEGGRGAVSVRDLAVTAGVLIDKSQILSGGATTRIEHIIQAPEHDDFNDYLASLKPADVQLIGCGEESPGQKAGDQETRIRAALPGIQATTEANTESMDASRAGSVANQILSAGVQEVSTQVQTPKKEDSE